MKIAMMVRGYIPVPRPKDMVYAPIDLEKTIGEGLATKGHQVDFYAPLGSKLDIPVVSKRLRPLAENQRKFQKLITSTDYQMHYIPQLWDFYLAKEMFKKAEAGYYDLLHFAHPEIAFPLAQFYPKVAVSYTMHDPVFELNEELYKMYSSPNQFYISISNNQRKGAPALPYIATVYNGVDLNDFKMSNRPGDYLLFAGRIVPDKGVKEAVQVALKSGQKLLIIGPVYKTGQAYFDKYVLPFLGEQIEYLGYVEREKLRPYMQKAKALILPLQWEEPFGMTMIEAMACGTPVLVNRRGSAPEIVVDGQTGFIVNNMQQMIKAVGKLDTIDRQACRRHVEEHFSSQSMIDGYEAAFTKALARNATSTKMYNGGYAPHVSLRLSGRIGNLSDLSS